MIYPNNTIFYTKDGRKSGNLTVIHSYDAPLYEERTYRKYICMSDYGNLVKVSGIHLGNPKQFYKTTGIATSTHKYYNYIESHPEILL